MDSRFSVEVRAGHRNPLRHGIWGADLYQVILSAPDEATAELLSVGQVRAYLTLHYPWLHITSAAVTGEPQPLDSAEATPEGVTEIGPA
jgi:hypothetical protein